MAMEHPNSVTQAPNEPSKMNGEVRTLVEDASALVSPPEVWIRLNEVINDPGSDAADVADVVACDSALTAKILRVVNSPFYNFPSRIDTISRAVTIIGTDELYSLATAISAARVFSNIPIQLVRPDIFWQHSICTGLAARRLARKCMVLHTERLYVAGMLHDIGSLVLYRKFPHEVSSVLMAAEGDEEVLYRVEQETFGFTHANVGAEMLNLWKLPPALLEAVRFHHEPDRARQFPFETAILHIANVAANSLVDGNFMDVEEPVTVGADPLAWDAIKHAPETMNELLDGLADELHDALELFAPY